MKVNVLVVLSTKKADSNVQSINIRFSVQMAAPLTEASTEAATSRKTSGAPSSR
jgi:hypothetical protein